MATWPMQTQTSPPVKASLAHLRAKGEQGHLESFLTRENIHIDLLCGAVAQGTAFVSVLPPVHMAASTGSRDFWGQYT